MLVIEVRNVKTICKKLSPESFVLGKFQLLTSSNALDLSIMVRQKSGISSPTKDGGDTMS